MEITYHKAEQNDLQTLVDYRTEFLIEFWGEQKPEDVIGLKKNLQAYFTKTLNDASYICYIAKSGKDVAGIGGIVFREQAGNFKNPSGKIGYLMNMYTVPSFRRKGICSSILKRLVEEAEARDVALLELHATKEGEPVYIQHGFKKHPEPTYRKYLNAR